MTYYNRLTSYNKRKNKPRAIIVHHSGYGLIRARGTVPGIIQFLAVTRKSKDGRVGFGYTYLVARGGLVHKLLEEDQVTWHAAEVNSTTIGVCLHAMDDRDVSDGSPEAQAQIAAAVELVRSLQRKYNIPNSHVYGHGEIESLLLKKFNIIPTRENGRGKELTEGKTVTDIVRNGTVPPATLVDELVVKSTVPGTSGGFGNPLGVRGAGAAIQQPFRYALLPPGEIAVTSSITPYLASFDSFHPNIQYELTRRRVSAETVNTYTPFVKLTSLVNVQSQHLVGVSKAWCPSLGIHGENSISFDDIYLPKDNRSIIGYALTSDPPIRVPVVVPSNVTAEDNSAQSSTTARVFDQRNIPMPGIVEIDAERVTAGGFGVRGGLMKANVKIFAYSVGQLDTLLMYYLRPATRVVLEWGRMSSNPQENITPFNWNLSDTDLAEDFTRLINDPSAQTKFIDNNIYQNYGSYEIFIGYVAKFDIKYNKNNVFEIMLTIHSVQQFELPTTHTGVRALCSGNSVDKCKAMDVREYFDESFAWKPNSFRQLLTTEAKAATPVSTADVAQTKSSKGFGDHLVAIKNPLPGTTTGAGSPEAGTEDNEFFVSWQFFVDKILNDSNRGLVSVIPDDKNLPGQELLKLGVLRPTAPIKEEEVSDSRSQLAANEVGYHPALRSTDPNVMIIFNPTAQNSREPSERTNFGNLLDASLTNEQGDDYKKNNHIEEWIRKSSVGAFKNIEESKQNEAGTGRLTGGVWLNTKAIKQAFSSADTVSSALNSLLSMMNAATQGYWNLQLYSADRIHSGLFVIDMGLSKRIEKKTPTQTQKSPTTFRELSVDPENKDSVDILRSISQITKDRYSIPVTKGSNKEDETNLLGLSRPKYIYMFNRGTVRFNDGELGGDLLDLNIEYNLPNVIAVQAIAGIGGSAQKSSLNAINLRQLQEISLIKGLYATCDTDECSKSSDCDANQKNLNALKRKWDATKIAVEGTRQQKESGITTVQLGDEVTGGTSEIDIEERIKQLEDMEQSARMEYNKAEILPAFGNVAVVDTVRELSNLGTLLEYIEFNNAAMMQKLNSDSTRAEDKKKSPVAHAFNSSNLTKTIVTLKLPGIGGIELFQSFAIDRVPTILQRGYYIVTKINHKFSTTDGWVTTLEGRFRYSPIEEFTPVPDADPPKPCQGEPPTDRPPSPPSGGSGGRATRGRTPPTANEQLINTPEGRFNLALSRYTAEMSKASNQRLRDEFDHLEKSSREPMFGLGRMATREAWDRRVRSGAVTYQRRQLEVVKHIMRTRNQSSIAAGKGGIKEFFGISNSRLAPKSWPYSTY